MANTQVGPNGVAVFNIWAYDDQPTFRDATGTLTISDTTYAYIARTTSVEQYMLVTKPGNIVPAGTTVTVTVTAHGQSLGGNPLPDLSIGFDLLGPVLPQATHFEVRNMSPRDKVGLTPPADPGSATISL